MKRLLDTNAYTAMKRGDPQVAELVRDSEALVFSLIVMGELLYGFRNGSRYSENLSELELFLDQPHVALHSPSRATADRFGRISTELRRGGTPIPTNDIWIAAETFETNAELVTFDHHFEHVPGLAAVVLG